jgi:DNA-binding CsgD family transcriptional regulator
MQSVPLGIAASSARSPLLGAYTLWCSAEFGACITEIQRLEGKLRGESISEAALLAARAYLRLDRPDDALRKLSRVRDVADVDVGCAVEALRGLALVFSGKNDPGMESIRRAIKRCERQNARFAVRMEVNFHKAFGHWLLGEFDEAETSARLVATAGVDILSARSVALIGWVAAGRLDYKRSLTLFREAWDMCRSCAGRDAHFEASLVHAIATYDSQLLACGTNPRYYGPDLPAASKAIDTFRLLVGSVDSWRAVLAGDDARALERAASTEATDVADHWRVFGMASRSGVLQSLGYANVSTALSSAAFVAAMSLDWSASPGESRFGLLHLAERLASCDLERAKTCIAAFSRIPESRELRYFGCRHPLHDALENYSRGVVAATAGEESAGEMLERAAQLFDGLGFRWRAAGARLLLGRFSPRHTGHEYAAALSFIRRFFPRSHLARELDGFVQCVTTETGARLSPAQGAIVRALCAGRSPRDIAKDRGTSVGTVRNQLKEIYRRTGLRSIQVIVSTFLSGSQGPSPTVVGVEERRLLRR